MCAAQVGCGALPHHVVLLGGHDHDWSMAVVCAVVCNTAQEELCHPALVVAGHHDRNSFQLVCLFAEHMAHTLCVNLGLQGSLQKGDEFAGGATLLTEFLQAAQMCQTLGHQTATQQ